MDIRRNYIRILTLIKTAALMAVLTALLSVAAVFAEDAAELQQSDAYIDAADAADSISAEAEAAQVSSDAAQDACSDGHSWGEWTVTKEPTYRSKGSRTRTCLSCGTAETQDTEKLSGYSMWVFEGGKSYYLNDKGSFVKLGWKKLRPNGDESEELRWCWFDKNGVFKKDISKNTAKKWIKAGGRKYYFTGDKKPAGKGFRLVGSKVYYFDARGAMVKGKFKAGGKTYKTRKDGSLGGLIYYKTRYKTFVLIDISEQKLRFYKKGKLKLKANVVTGHKGVHDTPTGVTHLISKARNVNLSGPTWNVNVAYWMLFRAGGYGMHDAPWRSAAQINSRNTYKSNGSHGCVNMKRSDAASLYSKISTGTTVIVCK